MTKEQREAEANVVIERRRKRKALPGRKRKAALRLEDAVTEALRCSFSADGKAPDEREGTAT